MSEAVIIVSVKLKPGASRERFLELGRQARLERQPDFVGCELYEGEDRRWTDVMTWASPEAMQIGRQALGAGAITDGFDQLIGAEHTSFLGQKATL